MIGRGLDSSLDFPVCANFRPSVLLLAHSLASMTSALVLA